MASIERQTLDNLIYRNPVIYGQLSYGELWEAYLLILTAFKNYNFDLMALRTQITEYSNICVSQKKELDSINYYYSEKINDLNTIINNLKLPKKLTFKERFFGKTNLIT